MKKVVRRQRVTEQTLPPMPGRLQDLIISPDSAYRLYEYQPGLFEPFLPAKHPGPDNVILFRRNRNLDLLERSKRWYIDGTFHFAPRLFSQVLVLLAEEHGGVHPVIYGLMPNKTAMIYWRFLDMILGLRANVTRITYHAITKLCYLTRCLLLSQMRKSLDVFSIL